MTRLSFRTKRGSIKANSKSSSARGGPVPVVVGGDPFFSSVVLLLGNDNAANNSTTFTDQSSSAIPMTTVSTAKYSNTFAPTGMTTSMQFNGTSDLLIINSTSAALTIPGDYTVEYMIRKNNNTNVCSPIGQQVGVEVLQYFDNTASIDSTYHAAFASTNSIHWFAGPTMNNNWRHVAVVRSGLTTTLWMDGAQVTLNVDQTGGTAPGSFSFSHCCIGAQGNAGAYFQNGLLGNMACLRVTKGVARYTGAFTVPTLPFPTS